MDKYWPDNLKVPLATQFISAILKLHRPMHKRANHEMFTLNFIPRVGKSDLETPERIWSAHNGLANSTKTQGPGGCHDVLNDYFGFWNWFKYVSLEKTLMSKYKATIVERNIEVEGHQGLTESLDLALVARWEELCMEWEDNSFLKTKLGPYHTKGFCPSIFTHIFHYLIHTVQP
jgi:Kyakuja-Dileera-Zisupton transposase